MAPTTSLLNIEQCRPERLGWELRQDGWQGSGELRFEFLMFVQVGGLGCGHSVAGTDCLIVTKYQATVQTEGSDNSLWSIGP